MTTAAHPVGLADMLTTRERRADACAALLRRPDVRCVVSLTLVTPGAVKDTPRWRALHRGADAAVTALFATHAARWPVVVREALTPVTGPESRYAVGGDATPADVKRALIHVEHTHPHGRLWDLDVLAPDGRPLSRADLGSPARRCLVCSAPAHGCARSGAHPPADVAAAVSRILDVAPSSTPSPRGPGAR